MPSTDAYSGIVYPVGGDDVDIVPDLLALVNSTKTKVVPTYATVTAFKNAGAVLIAADANVRFMAHIEGLGVLRYTGPDALYEWVGNHQPVTYQFASGSTGGAFNGFVTPAQWNTANYSFTSTASGWTQFSCETDAYKTTTGFGFAIGQVFLTLNGGSAVMIDQFNMIHEADTRKWSRWICPVNRYLTGGDSCLLTLKVYTSNAAGAWGLSGINWKVVQQ